MSRLWKRFVSAKTAGKRRTHATGLHKSRQRLFERLENRCLLAADIVLLSPSTAGFQINNSSRLGGIAVSVGELDANGQQTFVTEVLMTTGATHVNNQPLANHQIFGTKVYARNVSQPNVAAAYEFVGVNGYRPPAISANGRYVAEVIPGGLGQTETWFLPVGVDWEFHAGIRLDPNAPNGQFYPAGYYFENGSYYATYAEVPQASGVSGYSFGAIRVTDRVANTFFFIDVGDMLEPSVTSVSDEGDVAYFGVLYSFSVVPSPFVVPYFRSEIVGRVGEFKFKSNVVEAEVNGIPFISANGKVTASIIGRSIVRTDLVTDVTTVIDPYSSPFAPPAPGWLDISADGRYIVFTSSRIDLVPGDTNNKIDVFRYDSQDLTAPYFELVSKSLDGTLGNGDAYLARVSDDGRFIAFSSLATNLTGEFTPNNVSKVYVKDMLTGRVLLATSSLSDSSDPHISGNGRQVAFGLSSSAAGAFVSEVYGFYNSLSTNLLPVVAKPLGNASVLQGVSFSLEVPLATFTDPDETQGLVFSASLSSGAPLPAWLSFNPTTRRFSGTPANSDVGSLSISVFATDSSGGKTPATFTLRVDDLNESPVLANALPDASVRVRFPISYTIAANAFSDPDIINGDSLVVSARQVDGSPLPSWLNIAQGPNGTNVLYGTPPFANYSVDTVIPVRITATDQGGLSVFDDIAVTVTVPPIRQVPYIVYVDGSWFPGQQLDPDGAGPAQELFYDAFRDLQDAIDAVAPGGLVVVHSGFYAVPRAGGIDVPGGPGGGRETPSAITNRGKPVTIALGAGIQGEEIGQVNIVGNLELDSNATLELDLTIGTGPNNPIPGVLHDALNIFGGTATFNNPSLSINGPRRPVGFVYQVIQATNFNAPPGQPLIVGQFNNIANNQTVVTPNGAFLAAYSAASFSLTTVNQAPIALGDVYLVDEDTVLSTAKLPTPRSVLENDVDPDRQPVTILSVTAPPAGALAFNKATGQFSFRPAANVNVPVFFAYTVSDGTMTTAATVTVNVRPVNDPPEATADQVIYQPGQTRVIPAALLLANDRDLDGDALTVELIPGAVRGTVVQNPDGSISYTSPPGYTGSDSFRYRVRDASSASAVAVVSLNAAPAVEKVEINAESSQKQRSIVNTIKVTFNSVVALTDNAFEVRRTSGTSRTPLPPAQVNSLVPLLPIASSVVNGKTEVYIRFIGVGANPLWSLDDGTYSLTIVSSRVRALDGTELDGNGDGVAGGNRVDQFFRLFGDQDGDKDVDATDYSALSRATQYLWYFDFDGDGDVDVRDKDEFNKRKNKVTVGGTTVVTAEDTSAAIAISSLLTNDVIPGPRSFVALTAPINTANGGTVTQVGANLFYAPAANFNGPDRFVYAVSNGQATANLTQTVQVTEVNDAPTAATLTRDVSASVPTVFNLTPDLASMPKGPANESGQTLRVLRIVPTSITSGRTIVLNADGTITYTAPIGSTSRDTFRYEVIDNGTTNGVADPKTSIGTFNVDVLPFIPSTVHGTVYIDDNNTGEIEAGELRIGGVEVSLTVPATATSPSRTMSKQTHTDGSYTFDLLPPGVYTVTYVVPVLAIDSAGANSFTRTIIAPGGVDARYDFSILGVSPRYANLLENLASNYYAANGSQRTSGLYAAVGANGRSEWTITRDGFEGDTFQEVVLADDGQRAYVTAVRGATHSVFTATLTRQQFVAVSDPSGARLVRILARSSDLSWQAVSLAAPPVEINARARAYLDAVDELFIQENWTSGLV